MTADPAPPRRVIVIDAEGVHRARLRELSAHVAPLELDEADTTAAAFEKLERASYDVVLVDLKVGGESGIEIIAKLRERWPTIPCVLLAATDDPELVHAAMSVGAVDHLKADELAPGTLERALHRALRVGRAERQAAGFGKTLERQVALLSSLVEIAARMHRSETAEEAIESAVRATAALMDARVRLDLTLDEVRFSGAHDPFASGDAPFEHVLSIPLLAIDGAPAGELRIERQGDPFDRSEELAAAQLARSAAVAIEKHAWMEAARTKAREREEIMTIVSHDLRGPLQTLTFAFEALKGSRTPELVDDVVARSMRTVRRMWRLLDDLLDVSRVHDAMLSVVPRPISAAQVVREVVSQMQPHAEEREVVLDALPVAKELVVLADEQRLHQALGNLVLNAIRHTGTRVTLKVSADDECVRFDVVDDGSGVPPEHRGRLFQRLTQGQGATGSLGLGLYIVAGIASAHGGSAGIDATDAGGSSFWIRLPRAR